MVYANDSRASYRLFCRRFYKHDCRSRTELWTCTSQKNEKEIGISDFLIGGIAGLLFVAITEPNTILKTIGFSILGGFGGIATIERFYGMQPNDIAIRQKEINQKLNKEME